MDTSLTTEIVTIAQPQDAARADGTSVCNVDITELDAVGGGSAIYHL